MPKKKGSVPKKKGSVPKKKGSVPKKKGSVPKKKGSVPKKKGSVPKKKGSVPKKKGSVPKKKGSVPKKKSSVPKKKSSVPKKKGSVPKKKGHGGREQPDKSASAWFRVVCVQDCGQRRIGAVQCDVCGMTYTHGEPGDEATHSKFHQRLAALLRFPVSRPARFNKSTRLYHVQP